MPYNKIEEQYETSHNIKGIEDRVTFTTNPMQNRVTKLDIYIYIC